tara:strand:+ start:235 stop:486 length:252 start_codon:yes stop_codon:yes gene_type:complete
MAEVFGLSDVSSPDVGRGGSTKLKTGGIRRKYNMKKTKCKVGQVYNTKLKRCVSKKADLNKDGKISSYESKRSSAIEKAMRKK